jgi:hypothetical protein
MSTPTEHSEHGASSSSRWMNCPGSIALSAGMPDSTSVYAQEGTAAHAVGERALSKSLPADTWLDTVIEGVEVTEEMCDAVQDFVDHVNDLRLRMATKAVEMPTMLLEHRFNLERLNPPAPMFGTSDVTLWQPDTKHLEVVDYKHGRGVAVDATENSQLLYYALGAVVELGVKPSKIGVTIVQPRAHHPDGPIRRFEFDFDRLIAFKRELFEMAARTLDPDAELKAGEHCKFCKALAVCPAQRDMAVSVAQTEFSVVQPTPPAPATLTLDELTTVLQHASTLKDWLDSVRDHVIEQLSVGIEVPGWKLVPKRATRKWTSEDEAKQILVNLLGEEDAYTRKLLSPAQAEKALKTYGTTLPERLVSKESSGHNLAPASDPRPALPPSAHTDFDIPVEAPVETTTAKKRNRASARKTKTT